jgi:hypothetical protein
LTIRSFEGLEIPTSI